MNVKTTIPNVLRVVLLPVFSAPLPRCQEKDELTHRDVYITSRIHVPGSCNVLNLQFVLLCIHYKQEGKRHPFTQKRKLMMKNTALLKKKSKVKNVLTQRGPFKIESLQFYCYFCIKDSESKISSESVVQTLPQKQPWGAARLETFCGDHGD